MVAEYGHAGSVIGRLQAFDGHARALLFDRQVGASFNIAQSFKHSCTPQCWVAWAHQEGDASGIGGYYETPCSWMAACTTKAADQKKDTLTSSLPSIVDVKMMLPLFLLPLLCSNCTQITMKTRATMMIRRRRGGLPSWGRSRANTTHEYYRGLND